MRSIFKKSNILYLFMNSLFNFSFKINPTIPIPILLDAIHIFTYDCRRIISNFIIYIKLFRQMMKNISRE